MAFYHLYNRGVAKQSIFRTFYDYRRFLAKYEEYSKGLGIDTVCYALMPNHFHFLLGCLNGEPDLERLLRRLSTSHAMFFNRKYRRVGHLFQNRYRVKRVTNEFYFLHLSRYIHQNPIKLMKTCTSTSMKWRYISKYHYSSYPGYCKVAKLSLPEEAVKRKVPEMIFDDNNICLKAGVLARLFGSENQLQQYLRFVEMDVLPCEKKAIKDVIFDKNLHV